MVKTGDLEAIRAEAHKIKCAAANVGGMALSAAASEAECVGNPEANDNISAIVASVKGQF